MHTNTQSTSDGEKLSQSDFSFIPLNSNDSNREVVAIVGMGMRLPGGIHTSEEFWDLLVNKKSTLSKIPTSRFSVSGLCSPNSEAGTMKTDEGHFLADEDALDLFDISFFSTSKKQAEALDPQQRLLLEVVYECMQNSGQTNWRGRNIGCFVGVYGDVSPRATILQA